MSLAFKKCLGLVLSLKWSIGSLVIMFVVSSGVDAAVVGESSIKWVTTPGIDSRFTEREVYTISQPIGMIVVNRENRPSTCTAIIIKDDLILTGAHCILPFNEQESSPTKITLRMGYLIDKPPTESDEYDVDPNPLEINKALDFAILKVKGNPSAKYGVLPLFPEPTMPGDQLILVQHVRGEPLAYVQEDCFVRAVDETEIFHSCDTQPGSAGSVLMKDGDGAIVGLHVRGGRSQGEFGRLNAATNIYSMIDKSEILKSVIPEVRPTLTRLKNQYLTAAKKPAGPGIVDLEDFPDSIREMFSNNSRITIEGVETDVSVDSSGIVTLGDPGLLKRGLNVISDTKRKIIAWYEGLRLVPFENPYKKSYAIVASIDDYGFAGFKELEDMVKRAHELENTLIQLGFPKQNIEFLKNDEVTTERFGNAISKFWNGRQFSGADRLIIYFAGHGFKKGQEGFLVMSDFKEDDPFSGYPMNDFIHDHFNRLDVRQVLVLLDSCSSGMAIDGAITLDGDLDEDLTDPEFKDFKNRTIIEEDSMQKSRNIFVAGTSDGEALWRNGGIFTKALLTGLKDFNADGDRNGIIQTDELKIWVTNQVRAVARRSNFKQNPSFYHVPQLFGGGSMLFMRAAE